MKRLITLSLAWVIPLIAISQQILNGSFEGAGSTCGYNLFNPTFSNRMPNVVGFGEKNELDILNASCNYGSAYRGNTFVGMFCAAGITDAIALRLSEPMEPGKSYTLQFHLKIGSIKNGPARVSIGLTSNASSHGELLHTVFNLNNDWTRYQFKFKPPIRAEYLSVIVECAGEAWIFVDDFSFICPQMKLGNDTTYCELENVNLQVAKDFDDYEWSTGASGTTITVNEPGMYWVEVKLGGCTRRDSIELFEKPFLCNCKLYIPDIFSPNQDQHNDTWAPLSACELEEYELLIFNRWGALVFRSENISESWTGQQKKQNQPNGLYLYRVRYRFKGQEDAAQQDSGWVQLVR